MADDSSVLFLRYGFYSIVALASLPAIIQSYNKMKIEQETKPKIPLLTSEEKELMRSMVIQPERIRISFRDIAGLNVEKKMVYEEMILSLLRPELFKGILSSPKGILLYGSPGTGKTLLAKAVAKESKATFLEVKLSALVSKWYGETIKNANCLFSLAKKLQPSILFFDDLDSIFRSRLYTDNDTDYQLKCTLMSLWDGLINKDHRIIIIGATNRPWDLDDAIKRRMPKQIYIPLPGQSQRTEIIQLLMKKLKMKVDIDVDVNELASLTDGYSGSDLKAICQEAALKPIREASAQDIRKVTMDDFKEALQVIQPNDVDEKPFTFYSQGLTIESFLDNDIQQSLSDQDQYNNEDVKLEEEDIQLDVD